MNGKSRSSFRSGMKPETYLKMASSMQKYVGLPLEELQKQVFAETGDKPYDMLAPGPGLEMRAKKMGARLCLLEIKQEKARQIVAELRRRYERDCQLAHIQPVKALGEDEISSILGSDQGAVSQGQSSGPDSTEPPASERSSPQSQQQ